ncbi:MAG TPA: cupin domain-containing protein [Terriglobales bacterium]|nr:cupin domain-containing protein [Terriglobales bacterium]
MNSRNLRFASLAVLAVSLATGGYLIKVKASPSSGLTRTFIGRGTFGQFMVNTDTNQAPFQYIAKAQPGMDMEVDIHNYQPGATTGWHKHPGPVYITVTSGELTFYEYDDPTCSPRVFKAGQGFVDYGTGHIGFNKDPDNTASDVTVAITSVGGAFRTELPAPGPYCGF